MNLYVSTPTPLSVCDWNKLTFIEKKLQFLNIPLCLNPSAPVVLARWFWVPKHPASQGMTGALQNGLIEVFFFCWGGGGVI